MRIKLGTRGSPLALKQAALVCELIKVRCPQLLCEPVVIKTSGDLQSERPLAEIGNKGVFVKELESALLAKTIDVAVHSFKDLTSTMPPELELIAALAPEAIADSLVTNSGAALYELPPQAVIATSSVRRRVLLHRIRPDLCFVDIRGNVETRINKLRASEWDGLVLSHAGLLRLGLGGSVAQVFDPAIFIPAPGQGVIVLQSRVAESQLNEMFNKIADPQQMIITKAEQQVMGQLGFDCKLPFGLWTNIQGNMLFMKAFLAEATGQNYREFKLQSSIQQSLQTARELGGLILDYKQKLAS